MNDSRVGDELLAAARSAIGTGEPDDYRVAPARHTRDLKSSAPSLARILESASLETAASEFERFDAEAVQAQRTFKRTATRANRAVLATACLSAALLVVGAVAPPLPEWLRQALLAIFATLGVITGALAAMWIHRLKQGHLFERWMQARSRAEMRRLQYFERATGDTGGAADDDGVLLALQIEYFRRYQLDVQIAYYRERSRDHQQAADRTLQVEAIAVMLASIAAGLAGGLAVATLRPEYTSVAALGVLGAALASYAATRETISADQRNAERYARTLESLVALRERLDEVRRATGAGVRPVLAGFVEAVHEELSVEHRQWLDAADKARTSVARLEAALRSVRPGS